MGVRWTTPQSSIRVEEVVRLWEVPAGGGMIEPETVFPATGALSRDGHRFAYVEFAVAAPAAVWTLRLSRVGG